MKGYLITTGLLFAVVTITHLARTMELWHAFATEPWMVVGVASITVLTAALTVWSWRLVRKLPPSPKRTV